ncbi:hypothetical protein BOO91_06140 [Vibrio navarrensis]|uniref:DUF2799 domain-containing protein n=1 Tax=Vibrio navarrensis TaxID=29495 RepID=A0AAJ4ICC9_9VIBR|nr:MULTISPECIES: DUF2799 domain-containing protein [Vibrio]KJR31990.1 lipoprotein [Vibrio sp. S234-5]MBE3651522.1 hypothetical protein [Vibrio navarrensis]MBE3658026.1 hypothetical protein [Vibrio navarrensis]MBE3660520.1 hypothetical protein [Vibrio navarrensis]MBE4603504.1 hypothetical protein [Vibrio navarrensis]
MKQSALGVLLVALVGCASSTEELAKAGEWYQVGYQDGVNGRTQRSFKALAALGEVNKSDYDQGYLQGVDEYCNADFAYQIGLSGSYYEGVCEGTEQAQRFRMEWQRGWNEYQQ